MDRTEEDILEELHALDEEKQTIRQRMLALNQELDGVRARKKVAAMPDAEREALLQVVQAAGISSAEAVQ